MEESDVSSEQESDVSSSDEDEWSDEAADPTLLRRRDTPRRRRQIHLRVRVANTLAMRKSHGHFTEELQTYVQKRTITLKGSKYSQQVVSNIQKWLFYINPDNNRIFNSWKSYANSAKLDSYIDLLQHKYKLCHSSVYNQLKSIAYGLDYAYMRHKIPANVQFSTLLQDRKSHYSKLRKIDQTRRKEIQEMNGPADLKPLIQALTSQETLDRFLSLAKQAKQLLSSEFHSDDPDSDLMMNLRDLLERTDYSWATQAIMAVLAVSMASRNSAIHNLSMEEFRAVKILEGKTYAKSYEPLAMPIEGERRQPISDDRDAALMKAPPRPTKFRKKLPRKKAGVQIVSMYRCEDHKSKNTHGSARVIVSGQLRRLVYLYAKYIREAFHKQEMVHSFDHDPCPTPGSRGSMTEKFLLNFKGKPFTASSLNTNLKSWQRQNVQLSTNSEHPLSTSDIRKAINSNCKKNKQLARSLGIAEDEESASITQSLASALCHSQSVNDKYYSLECKDRNALKVHKLIRSIYGF